MKNPPAYPSKTYYFGELTGTRREGDETPGLSLLDHFAGLAMQGMISNPHFNSQSKPWEIVTLAFAVGRQMLEERAKPENQL